MPIFHELQLARRKYFHRCVPVVHAVMWIHLVLKTLTCTVFIVRRWNFTHFPGISSYSFFFTATVIADCISADSEHSGSHPHSTRQQHCRHRDRAHPVSRERTARCGTSCALLVSRTLQIVRSLLQPLPPNIFYIWVLKATLLPYTTVCITHTRADFCSISPALWNSVRARKNVGVGHLPRFESFPKMFSFGGGTGSTVVAALAAGP